MKDNRNQPQFDIPIPVILLALIFSFPIGVILAVLRAVSTESGRKTVQTTTQRAGEKASEAIKKAGDEFREWSRRTSGGDSSSSAPNGNRMDTARNNSTKIKRKRRPSAGTVFSWIFCILFLIIGVFSLFAELAAFEGWISFFKEMLKNVVSFMTLSGISYLFTLFFKGKESDYNLIRAIIGDRDSVNLGKIAAAAGKRKRAVMRDVQHLINRGEFGDSAYIDKGSGCFMRYPDAVADSGNESVYGQSAPSADDHGEGDVPPTGEEGKDRFRAIILEIRKLNDDIHDFAVSERIYRIEEHTQNIFDYVTEHPEAMPKIRTFMNYYLPTTLKLLESYRTIERMGVAGENMQKSKEQIENILDLLVAGFEQQMDHLYSNESIDISSDISVLETMMKKDGLSGKSDFQTRKEVDFGGMAAQTGPYDEKE